MDICDELEIIVKCTVAGSCDLLCLYTNVATSRLQIFFQYKIFLVLQML